MTLAALPETVFLGAVFVWVLVAVTVTVTATVPELHLKRENVEKEKACLHSYSSLLQL